MKINQNIIYRTNQGEKVGGKKKKKFIMRRAEEGIF